MEITVKAPNANYFRDQATSGKQQSNHNHLMTNDIIIYE